MGGGGWRGVGVRERARKRIRSIRCGCKKGTIQCTVTGRRKYSADLAQGGLEVPCSLLFKATPEEIKKLKKLWKFTSLATKK